MEILTGSGCDNVELLHNEFIKGKPVPSILIPNFLKTETALELYNESQYDDSAWKVFTRNGSYMKEYNNIELLPNAYKFYSYIHSKPFLDWLQQLTGIKGLIPDPHLVGAGYSKSFNGDILKVHTDFNWNDTLRLYRAVSLIVYLTPDWQEEWGGGLSFFDDNREEVISTLPCLFNNCAVWKYDERAFHGYTKPISCPDDKSRNSIRAFYYTSQIENVDTFKPHRSLYWFDENTKQPFDKREEI